MIMTAKAVRFRGIEIYADPIHGHAELVTKWLDDQEAQGANRQQLITEIDLHLIDVERGFLDVDGDFVLPEFRDLMAD
jgi:hypothetical protein